MYDVNVDIGGIIMETTLKKNLDQLREVAKERTVRTQDVGYNLETLVGKIEKGVIRLNPEYQRHHRWDDETSSRLIESLILNIPIPTVYISQDVDVDDEIDEGIARYSVIDGQQRLTAIYEFMKNKYALTGLKVLDLLNGLMYRDLPPFLIRRLEERGISCLWIDSVIDPQVKYDIFERLNTGAVQLESQELRNAVYRGPFNDMIKKLAEYKKYRLLLHIGDKDFENNKVKKMMDTEMVLRYFALCDNGIEKMKKSLKDFLSEQMDRFNRLDKKELEKMEEQFYVVIDEVYEKLGENAFAKYRNNRELQSKFNAAVYDAVMVAVSDKIKDGSLRIEEQNIIKFNNLFEKIDFRKNIEGSTGDKSKINGRIKMTKEVFS